MYRNKSLAYSANRPAAFGGLPRALPVMLVVDDEHAARRQARIEVLQLVPR